MNIEIIHNLQELEALKDEWNALYDRCNSQNIFIAHSWVAGSLRNFGENGLHLVLCRSSGGDLVAVLPLKLRPFRMKGFACRALTHVCEQSADYAGYLVSPALNVRQVTKKIIDYIDSISDQWDYVIIGNLCDDCHASNCLRVMLSRLLYGGTISSLVAPYIRLDTEYEEIKVLKDIRRRFRKANQSFNIELHIGVEANAKRLEQLRVLHSKIFTDQGFNTNKNQTFYRELMVDSDFSDKIEFSWVEIDGEMAAGHFGFRTEERVYYYVPAYDRKFSAYSVGLYLLASMINHYREIGFKEFDFLMGDENYKFNWANAIHTNHLVFGMLKNRRAPLQRLMTNLWLMTRSLPYYKD